MTTPKPVPRVKIDWEAVERDYRASKLTLREMAAKYGCKHSAIANKAKRDGWSRDLAKAVRKATSAALIEEAVTKAVTSREQAVTETVRAAAELNKQIVLAHRGDLRQARDVAFDLLAELRQAAMTAQHQELLAEILAGEGAEPKDVNEARRVVARALGLGSRVNSVKSLAEALTKLQVAERKAFGLDDEGSSDENPIAELLAHMGASSLPVVKDAT